MNCEEEALAALLAAQDAERDAHEAAERAKTNHIRKRPAKTPFGLSGPRYATRMRALAQGHWVDPSSQTLCGQPATTYDLSWAETTWAKNRTYVACQTCVQARLADGTRN